MNVSTRKRSAKRRKRRGQAASPSFGAVNRPRIERIARDLTPPMPTLEEIDEILPSDPSDWDEQAPLSEGALTMAVI